MTKGVDSLMEALTTIPNYWSGMQSVTEMKNSKDPNWKQMEWIGWYFQFWCKNKLQSMMTIPCPKKYDRVEFDGFFHYPVDFKSHVQKDKDIIPLNDMDAMFRAIGDFQKIRLVIALGKSDQDINNEFKKWHDKLKGGLSEYEKERIKRGSFSRIRKKGFFLEKIVMLDIDEEMLLQCTTYQKGFRNSNGKSRKTKLQLDLNKIEDQLKTLVDFSGNKPKKSNLDEFF